jgi:ankyrin repeat protein
MSVDKKFFKACEDGNVVEVSNMIKKWANKGGIGEFFHTQWGHRTDYEENYTEKIDEVDMQGRTPLWIASANGRLPVVKVLLDYGADPNKARNDDGFLLPLYVASWKGYNLVVEALLEKGADPNKARTGDGRTPLYRASEKGYLDIVEALLNHGAAVNVRDRWGETPLIAATDRGHHPVVEALLQHGAAVDLAQTHKGLTPLIIATMIGNLDIVKALLNHGADPNKTNNVGRTPLYYACLNDNHPVVEALLGKGADINEGKDETPIQLVTRMNQDQLANLMRDYEQKRKTMIGVHLFQNLNSGPNDMRSVNTMMEAESLIDLHQYVGKQGIDYGGRRRKTRKSMKSKKSRKSKKSKKSRKSKKRLI